MMVLPLLLAAAPADTADVGSIVGTVTAGDTGDPLVGACVLALRTDLRASGSADVAADGSYAILDLPAGDYRVVRYPCTTGHPSYPLSWYPGVAGYNDATVLTVGTGTSTVASLVVPLGGTITGRMLAGDTGEPLHPDCSAMALPEPQAFSDGLHVRFVHHGEGRYSVGPVHPGSVLLRLDPCGGGSPYVARWHGDAQHREDAHVIEVSPGATIELGDGVLPRGGSIAGQVVDVRDGTPIERCSVRSYGPTWGGATTDASGRYEIAGLDVGDHRLEFHCSSASDPYFPQWYADAPDRASSEPVRVTLGERTAGIDVGMVAPARITGRVTMAGAGEAAADACVTLEAADGAVVRKASAYADGDYELHHLRPGPYTVRFAGCGDADGLLGTWWGGTRDRAEATVLDVTPGAEVTGIDGEVAHPGSIAGRLTSSATDGPAADTCVEADDGVTTSRATSAADGTYRIDGLWPGEHTVLAAGCSSHYDTASAEPVDVPAGGTVSGVDLWLVPSTTIGVDPPDAARWMADGSHTVTATVVRAGAPVAGVLVRFVVSGANRGTYPVVTGPDGRAVLRYANSALLGGRDTVTATIDLDEDGERDGFEPRSRARVTWTALPPG